MPRAIGHLNDPQNSLPLQPVEIHHKGVQQWEVRPLRYVVCVRFEAAGQVVDGLELHDLTPNLNRTSSGTRDEGSRATVNCGGSASLETMLMRVQQPPVEVSVISRRASGSRDHPTIVPACGMRRKKLICWRRAIRSAAASFLTMHLATQSDLEWTPTSLRKRARIDRGERDDPLG